MCPEWVDSAGVQPMFFSLLFGVNSVSLMFPLEVLPLCVLSGSTARYGWSHPVRCMGAALVTACTLLVITRWDLSCCVCLSE